MSAAVTPGSVPRPEHPLSHFGPRRSAVGGRNRSRAGVDRWRPSLLALALLATTPGCGNPTDRPAAATGGDSPRSDQGPVAAADSSPSAPAPGGRAAEAVDEADLPAVLAGLTQAARRYGLEQRRAPASLEELVAKGYLARIPEAPGGGRFVIDKQLQVRLEK